jgi:hypothetical protein
MLMARCCFILNRQESADSTSSAADCLQFCLGACQLGSIRFEAVVDGPRRVCPRQLVVNLGTAHDVGRFGQWPVIGDLRQMARKGGTRLMRRERLHLCLFGPGSGQRMGPGGIRKGYSAPGFAPWIRHDRAPRPDTSRMGELEMWKR